MSTTDALACFRIKSTTSVPQGAKKLKDGVVVALESEFSELKAHPTDAVEVIVAAHAKLLEGHLDPKGVLLLPKSVRLQENITYQELVEKFQKDGFWLNVQAELAKAEEDLKPLAPTSTAPVQVEEFIKRDPDFPKVVESWLAGKLPESSPYFKFFQSEFFILDPANAKTPIKALQYLQIVLPDSKVNKLAQFFKDLQRVSGWKLPKS